MMLPDIDFQKIRLHRGTQDYAFEELCCQLAALEERQVGSAFYRKGRGADGGIECFVRNSDGTEIGWQAKFYHKMDNSLLKSLDGSLSAALKKHPKLVHFIVCIPFDPSNSDTSVTALDRWKAWRSAKIAEAAKTARNIEIELWGASQLKQRLTADEPARQGRVFYWFDVERLSPDWFARKLDRSIEELGARYTAESNIELPLRQVLHAMARDPLIMEEREAWSAALSEATREGPLTSGLPEEQQLSQLLLSLHADISETIVPADGDCPVEQWRTKTAEAESLARLLWRTRADEGKNVNPAASFSGQRLSEIVGRLGVVEDGLQQKHWRHINNRALLITGEAGMGKSHLVADGCKALVAERRPAILLMGSKFVEGSVWQQIVRELDLPDMMAKVFLGALDAAAQAAGTRLLFVIDGINERNGVKIWPDRLAGMLHDLAEFPRISAVLTCRSTYLESVIPDSLSPAKLPRVEHSGFSSNDARAYLAQRKVILPTYPFPLAELQTPLFLKVCCDALDKKGEKTFPKGMAGVSDVFGFYSDAVVASINRKMELTRARLFPQRAIDALAKEIEVTGEREIAFDRAAELVDSIYRGSGRQDDDLLFQLEAEGMITKELTYIAGEDPVDGIRFVFERFGDHVVANGILSSISAPGGLHELTSSQRLKDLFDEYSAVTAGVLEAIAVQLPEQFEVEILDLVEDVSWPVSQAFYKSLTARNPASVSDHAIKLLQENANHRQHAECLIALSIEPATKFNARYLHDLLTKTPINQRDAFWSTGVAESYAQDDSRTKRFLDWALAADDDPIWTDRSLLAAIVLSWVCSTTHSVVRDRATYALATLMSHDPMLAIEVVHLFSGVDDPYVVERVALAIYGAALQGTWSNAGLSDVVQAIVSTLPTYGIPNALIRDHIQSLVLYASNRGARPAGIPEELLFKSDWPLELIADETIEAFTRTYRTGYVFRDEIVSSSVEDGNFARYVIDKMASKYSAAPKGAHALPSDKALKEVWVSKFNASQTPDKQAALAVLMMFEEYDAKKGGSWHPSNGLKKAREGFRSLVGVELYEEFRVYAMRWRRGRMFQDGHLAGGLACFNLAWARRWVCKRAHGWGWAEKLHGDFDLEVAGRHAPPNIERIGKKYQWLALFELSARLKDNLELLPDRYPDEFGRLTNFDPTAPAPGNAYSKKEGYRAFWMPSVERLPNMSPEEAIAWRDSSHDFVDGEGAVEIADPDGKLWLALSTFRNWRLPSSKPNAHFVRDLWSRVNCVVVKKSHANAVLKKLASRNLADDSALPSHERLPSKLYLGEHGWRSHPAGAEPRIDWASEFTRGDWRGIAHPAYATTSAYERENHNPDHPLSNIEVALPSLWLMTKLNLRLLDGRRVIYGQNAGETAFFDPSIGQPGPSVGLIDRDKFLRFLEQENLVAIWAVAGEKNLYSDNNDGFGGRVTYSRLSYSNGDKLVHLERRVRLEKPSKEQLRKFTRLDEVKPKSLRRRAAKKATT